jgi:hypothetical protein
VRSRNFLLDRLSYGTRSSHFLKTDTLESFIDPRLAQCPQLRNEREVLSCREALVEPGGVADVLDPAADLVPLGSQMESEDPALALGGRQRRRQHLQQRRLSGAVRPAHQQHFALLEPEVDANQSGAVLEEARDSV